jgi:hypothetical protein
MTAADANDGLRSILNECAEPPRAPMVREVFTVALTALILIAVALVYASNGETRQLAEEIRQLQLEGHKNGHKNRAVACLNYAAQQNIPSKSLMPGVCQDPEVAALYSLIGDGR